jgi:hypothetical protein
MFQFSNQQLNEKYHKLLPDLGNLVACDELSLSWLLSELNKLATASEFAGKDTIEPNADFLSDKVAGTGSPPPKQKVLCS